MRICRPPCSLHRTVIAPAFDLGAQRPYSLPRPGNRVQLAHDEPVSAGGGHDPPDEHPGGAAQDQGHQVLPRCARGTCLRPAEAARHPQRSPEHPRRAIGCISRPTSTPHGPPRRCLPQDAGAVCPGLRLPLPGSLLLLHLTVRSQQQQRFASSSGSRRSGGFGRPALPCANRAQGLQAASRQPEP